MSAIDPDSNIFDIAPSAQDLLDESLVNSALGADAELGPAGSAGTVEEPPEEEALDAYNEYSDAAYEQWNKELEEGVPSDLLDAQQITSTLVGGVVAQATEAWASAAQELEPETVFSLIS